MIHLIRGPRGTKVRLVVQTEGGKERKVYELTRDRIDPAAAHARAQVIERPGEDGRVMKIGIIKLPSFYGNDVAVLKGDPGAVSATRDVREILKGFKGQGVMAVAVDLRTNGGGLLSEAVSLAGLFIDTGPVLQYRDASLVAHLDDDDPGTAYDGPLVLVTDRISAAASEIFAATVQDYGRGLVIGDASTFGMGTTGTFLDVAAQLRPTRDPKAPSLGGLRVTTSQNYRVDGKGFQVRGVFPHIHIPSVRDVSQPGEGGFENALKPDQVAPIPHDQYNRTPPDLVANLTSRSRARRADSPEFLKEDELIRKYLERKARHSIPLNEAKFRKDWGGAGAGEVAPADRSKGEGADQAVWKSDAYNDEVIAIIVDYVTLEANAFGAPIARAELTVTLANGDAARKLYLRDEATGADIVLQPGATLTHSFPAHGTLLYFARADSRDPGDWKRHELGRQRGVRFKLVNGTWVPEGILGPRSP